MTETIAPATFTIKVRDIKTTTIGELTNVVKEVKYTISATKSGITTPEREFTAILGNPTVEGYIPFTDLSEDKIIEFISNSDEKLPHIKIFLEAQLNSEIDMRTLMPVQAPWIAVNSIMLEKVPEVANTDLAPATAILMPLPVSSLG